MKYVLASASPRRQQLLQQLLTDFTVVAPQVPEQQQPAETATAYVERLAVAKARAGQQLVGADRETLVIGSDTVVVRAGQVLEKPRDKADYQAMMRALSGQVHQVLTAVAVARGEQCEATVVSTDVHFKTLSATEIESYWATGEPHDKAGGYGIQGAAGKFVRYLAGSYFAVVGLPLFETQELIERMQGASA